MQRAVVVIHARDCCDGCADTRVTFLALHRAACSSTQPHVEESHTSPVAPRITSSNGNGGNGPPDPTTVMAFQKRSMFCVCQDAGCDASLNVLDSANALGLSGGSFYLSV